MQCIFVSVSFFCSYASHFGCLSVKFREQRPGGTRVFRMRPVLRVARGSRRGVQVRVFLLLLLFLFFFFFSLRRRSSFAIVFFFFSLFRIALSLSLEVEQRAETHTDDRRLAETPSIMQSTAIERGFWRRTGHYLLVCYSLCSCLLVGRVC